MTERDATKQTVRAFLWDVLKRVVSPDGRILRTFVVLIRRPGELTREYFDDIADDYIHPFEVFLLANVFFFVVGGITHNQMLTTHLDSQLHGQWHSVHARRLFNREVSKWKVASWNDATRDSVTEVSRAQAGTELLQPPAQRAADYLRYRVLFATVVARFDTRYNDASENDARSLVILMVPLLALVVALLQFRRGTGVQHIVFSLHFYAFALVMYSVTWAAGLLGFMLVHWQPSDGMWGIILFGLQTWYMCVAMGGSYGDGRFGRLVKGLIAGAASLLLIQLYRFLLFLFVFHTVR
jgi:hypothetical protein